MATYIRTKPEPYCPECGAKMALRRPKPSQDFEPFWGCSQYPDCRGTRRVVEVNEDQLPMFPDPDSESEDKMSTPSVGRIVHYVAYGTPGGEYPAGVHRAAIITHVHDEMRVSLCVLNPTGLFFNQGCKRDDAGEKPGTWHWPEYVPDNSERDPDK